MNPFFSLSAAARSPRTRTQDSRTTTYRSCWCISRRAAALFIVLASWNAVEVPILLSGVLFLDLVFLMLFVLIAVPLGLFSLRALSAFFALSAIKFPLAPPTARRQRSYSCCCLHPPPRSLSSKASATEDPTSSTVGGALHASRITFHVLRFTLSLPSPLTPFPPVKL